MVLVVAGLLIWNFATRYETGQHTLTFSEFMSAVEAGNIQRVTITGQEITGTTKDAQNQTFRTYAPTQYEGLANKLIDRGIAVQSKEPTASPWASLLYNWAPFLVMIGFWVFFMRQMQRWQQGALVRQEQGEAVVQFAEEGDVQGRRRRRRSEGRTPGNHRVPQGTAEIPETG